VPGVVLTVTLKRGAAAFLINMNNYVLKSLKKIFLDFAPRGGSGNICLYLRNPGRPGNFERPVEYLA
jgi:hypothetical protein